MTKAKKRFSSSPAGVIFNPIPENEEEVLEHGNALARSGDYPVGTSGCFNVGISGGCGLECFIYQKGECENQDVFREELSGEELKQHKKLYPEKNKL